jgi:hypothetical protein
LEPSVLTVDLFALQLQGTHSLVTELSAVAAKESTLLNEYRELLATAAALQVQSCFLFAISVSVLLFWGA